MKAVILAGGFGTRLRPLSCTRPKILFPIVNKPLLQWIFERLVKSNVENAILAVNQWTEMAIKQHKLPTFDLQTIFSRDPPMKPLGTGGPIKLAEKHIGHDAAFLVLNGDIFADVNYREILEIHEQEGALATIALRQVDNPSRYGVVEITQENRIMRFIEKPKREETPSHLINAGVYVFNPDIFKYIPETQPVSMEHQVFPKLAEKGKLYGYIYDGLWKDVGNPNDYVDINKILLDPSFDLSKFKFIDQIKITPPIAFDEGVFIDKNSVIGPNTVLGRNVTVGKKVSLKNSIIFPETQISDLTRINNAIIGEGVIIGKKVKIEKDCIIGDYVKIRENISIAQDVSICPRKEVTEDVLTRNCII